MRGGIRHLPSPDSRGHAKNRLLAAFAGAKYVRDLVDHRGVEGLQKPVPRIHCRAPSPGRFAAFLVERGTRSRPDGPLQMLSPLSPLQPGIFPTESEQLVM